MNDTEMIALVKRYFTAVDSEDFPAIQSTITDDCIFTVETHGIKLESQQAIESMFTRLWGNHASVRHQDFVYVPAPDHGRIAVRFAVINTHHDGKEAHKSNCNFFKIRDGKFCQIAVYMAGENTLDAN
jgi:ketosteroid isomerase-like protein